MKAKFNILFICIIFSVTDVESQAGLNSISHDSNLPGVSGSENCGYGDNALNTSGTGNENTATGFQAMTNNVTGSSNSANGYQALYSNLDGAYNTASGYQSLYTNGTIGGMGHYNTATGFKSLFGNSNGANNTAFGFSALKSNTGGNNNTAIGYEALKFNADAGGVYGEENTAIGAFALHENVEGSQNTAAGRGALFNNVSGSANTGLGMNAIYENLSYSGGGYLDNTAAGYEAMKNVSDGAWNCALGTEALFSSVGSSNYALTAVGYRALYSNYDGFQNTAIGASALLNNISGSGNVAIGSNCMANCDGVANTAAGAYALIDGGTSEYNTAAGHYAFSYANPGDQNSVLGAYSDLISGAWSNASAIGAFAQVNADDKMRIGEHIGSSVVETQNTPTTVSDARFKTNVKEEVKGLEFITKLRPVTYAFDYDKLDRFLAPSNQEGAKHKRPSRAQKNDSDIRLTGFIAQEVEQAALQSGYDFSGVIKPKHDKDNYALAYGMFVVPLVKALQEQQKMIDEEAKITRELKERLNVQSRQMDERTTNNASLTGLIQTQVQDGFYMDVMPNPFTTETTVKYRLAGETEAAVLMISSLAGRQVASQLLTNKNETTVKINNESITPGIYLFSIIFNGKLLGTKRVIISSR